MRYESCMAPAGSFSALECSRALGLGESGSVRVGLAPYTDDDVDASSPRCGGYRADSLDR